jgi:hypothetical protein
MMADYSDAWLDDYLGSRHEARRFRRWTAENPGTLDDYRETQEWKDLFLDWAFECEATRRMGYDVR